MAKNKRIRHMGMTMTEEQHRRWHEQHEGKELTVAEHKKLMAHLGISEQEDKRWHQAEEASGEEATDLAPDAQPVNPFAIGGGFLEYCVRQGWLIRRGRGKAMKYYLTGAGREALAEYGITKY